MSKAIRVTNLQRDFHRVLDEVANNRVAYVLTRRGHPEAALIRYEDHLRFRQVQETVVKTRMALLVAKMGRRNAESQTRR